MALLLLSIAALAVPGPSPESTPRGAVPAARASSGAEASATVTARIISRSARIGAGLPRPVAGMVPRAMRIATRDGSSVAALVYDFE